MLLLGITKFLRKIESCTTKSRILEVRRRTLSPSIILFLFSFYLKKDPSNYIPIGLSYVSCLLGNIRVYCRVRPFLPGQACNASTIGRIDDGTITIITPAKYSKEGRKSFTFNKVFGPSATQGEWLSIFLVHIFLFPS